MNIRNLLYDNQIKLLQTGNEDDLEIFLLTIEHNEELSNYIKENNIEGVIINGNFIHQSFNYNTKSWNGTKAILIEFMDGSFYTINVSNDDDLMYQLDRLQEDSQCQYKFMYKNNKLKKSGPYIVVCQYPDMDDNCVSLFDLYIDEVIITESDNFLDFVDEYIDKYLEYNKEKIEKIKVC